jgi:ABC-type branched-subunit amino acid transport system substrate-binding protein
MKLTPLTRKLGALALAGAALAACSSNSSSSSTTAASSGSGSAVKLGFLWQIKGEGAYGQNDYQYGAQLAVDQINAAGGVNGKKVTFFREAADPTDNQQTLSSYLSAVGQNPTALIGIVAPTQIQALSSEITRGGVPLLATTTSDVFDAYGATSGSKYLWFLGASNPALAAYGTNYLVKDLNLSKIGVMGTNESYGTEGQTTATATLASHGLKPYASTPYSPTATDLTQEVLAQKGADAVIDWGYPNTIAVQLNQFVQNGIDIPTMTSDGVDTTVASGLAKGQALANLYASQPCDLTAPSYTARLTSFVSAFKAKYGYVPSQNAAWAYDGVYVAVAAVKHAGSTSPTAVNNALATISVPGACSTVYKADAAHFMAHTEEISKFSSDGTSKVVKVSTIPPTAAGQ